MTVMSMHSCFLMFDQIMFTGKRKFGKCMHVRRKTIQKRILEHLCIRVLRANKELRKGRFVTAMGRPAAARCCVCLGRKRNCWPLSSSFKTCAHKVPVRCQQSFQSTTVRFSLFFVRYSRRLEATGFQVGANSDAPTWNLQNIKDRHIEESAKKRETPYRNHVLLLLNGHGWKRADFQKCVCKQCISCSVTDGIM